MTLRAAVYARYSSDLQKATSIEDQIAMAQRLCDQQGWTLVHVFTDEEMTGRNTRRPGFQSLKTAVGQRQIDVVIVEAIDRLSRSIRDSLDHYELLTFHGIELHSVTEGRQDFFRVLLGALGAQLYSESISKHTRRGMQGALTRGQLHTSAYGYRKRVADTGPNREIDPDTAPIVRRIFEELAAGKSTHAIAKGLNGDGIPGPTGGSWDSSTLRGNTDRAEGMVRNRLYIGIASVCKYSRSYHPETGAKRVFGMLSLSVV